MKTLQNLQNGNKQTQAKVFIAIAIAVVLNTLTASAQTSQHRSLKKVYVRCAIKVKNHVGTAIFTKSQSDSVAMYDKQGYKSFEVITNQSGTFFVLAK